MTFAPDIPDVVPRVIAAANYTPMAARKPTLLILHVTENEPTAPAEAVAGFFAGQPVGGGTSAHVVSGGAGSVQCVPFASIAYSAPGANLQGIHHELVGRVTQTWPQWLDSGVPQEAANVDAAILVWAQLPCVLVGAEDMLAGMQGIGTHWDVTMAQRLAFARGLTSSPFYPRPGHALGTHTDPWTPRGPLPDGQSFDLLAYLGMVQDVLPPDYLRPDPGIERPKTGIGVDT